MLKYFVACAVAVAVAIDVLGASDDVLAGCGLAVGLVAMSLRGLGKIR